MSVFHRVVSRSVSARPKGRAPRPGVGPFALLPFFPVEPNQVCARCESWEREPGREECSRCAHPPRPLSAGLRRPIQTPLWIVVLSVVLFASVSFWVGFQLGRSGNRPMRVETRTSNVG